MRTLAALLAVLYAGVANAAAIEYLSPGYKNKIGAVDPSVLIPVAPAATSTWTVVPAASATFSIAPKGSATFAISSFSGVASSVIMPIAPIGSATFAITSLSGVAASVIMPVAPIGSATYSIGTVLPSVIVPVAPVPSATWTVVASASSIFNVGQISGTITIQATNVPIAQFDINGAAVAANMTGTAFTGATAAGFSLMQSSVGFVRSVTATVFYCAAAGAETTLVFPRGTNWIRLRAMEAASSTNGFIINSTANYAKIQTGEVINGSYDAVPYTEENLNLPLTGGTRYISAYDQPIKVSVTYGRDSREAMLRLGLRLALVAVALSGFTNGGTRGGRALHLTFHAPLTSTPTCSGDGSTAWTFTRNSIATYVDATSGLVVQVPANVARFEAGGYLSEGARTNYCLYSDDLSNPAWTSTDCTTAYTSTGADGIANHATRITATGANATVMQAIVRASAARVTSVWIKRITGTGNIDLTQDNGATWTTVTITSAWTRVSIAAQTIANPTVGIRIVTSGDAVDVQYFQHEEGAFISSAIPTTTAAVTRAADVLSYASAGNWPEANGTLSCAADANVGAFGGAMVYTSPSYPLYRHASLSSRVQSYDGTNVSFATATVPSTNRYAVTWGGSALAVYVNGTAGTGAAYDGSFNASVISVGVNWFGHIRDVRIWNVALTALEVSRYAGTP